MCDVAAAVAVGTAVAGAYMQQQGQQQARKAQDREAAAAITVSGDRDERARGAVMDAVPNVSQPAVASDMEAAANSRRDAYAAATPAEAGYLPGQSTGPSVVQTAVDRERASNTAEISRRADALARLGSWGDAMSGIRRNLGDATEVSALEGSFARRDGGAFARRFAAAGREGEGMRTAGNIVTAVGPAASVYGTRAISGAFTPTAAAPKNKPAAL